MITDAKPVGLGAEQSAALELPAGTSQNGPHSSAISYGVLLLPSLFNGAGDRQELLLPLTVAYLLSAHVPFRFPLPESAIIIVERLFDGILNGLPKESKGILYVTNIFAEDISALLQHASLVLTDEAGLEQGSGLADVPQAVVCRAMDNMRMMKLRSIEKLYDPELQAKLAACAQLINAQSAGFITEGHFSLSW